MPTTFCFDFGNTRMKVGVFKGRELESVEVLPSDENAVIIDLLDKYRPDKAILSSVINHRPEIEALLAQHCRFHKLNHQSVLNFTTPVGRPDTIGADRLALVAAAVDNFPDSNKLVIGLGTCITFNFINRSNEFVGGSISPGMEMRFKSLNHFTAKLPIVEKDWNFSLIGYDTRTNILSGVILGMAKEIDGVIDEYKNRYRNFNVVLTGGDAPYFVYHLKNKIFADPNFIFKGLYAISEKNNV
ncbi:MAG TPA: type III pantothenate kinase [Flavitalea sp.]|nr:type III pantothenate kinase [Flavitalea sp.]